MTALLLGQGLYGLAMGMSNSHEMSYRQLVTPDELQARTNTTLRSTNRAVIVIAAPVTSVVADAWGMTHARYGPILASLEETAVPPPLVRRSDRNDWIRGRSCVRSTRCLVLSLYTFRVGDGGLGRCSQVVRQGVV